MKRTIAALFAMSIASAAARADEGMWTYNNFPREKVKQKYGFQPEEKWLDEARLSSVRLAGGCSGSFVSPQGLVMTNHHCAHSCIEQLSTARRDFVKSGFYAPAFKDEVKCPEIELNQLLSLTDVTARMEGATKGLQGKEFADAQKAAMSTIETECAGGDDKLRCDVVTLYHGGVYNLYKYKRFQDVRLVFAPELAIAFFGGDPDNFNFPRYDLDVSFVRAYENGKPAHTDHHFSWAPHAAKPGDLTFVSGHPGGTDRDLTMSELEYQRDIALPERLLYLAEYRGALTEFTHRSPEAHRIGEAELFGVENSFKALKGRALALIDPKLVNEKAAHEKELRGRVAADQTLAGKYGKAWDEIARMEGEFKRVHKAYNFKETPGPMRNRLFGIARALLRWSEESQKPSEKRLKEYRDSALPQLKQALFSAAPIYDELEIFRATFSLTKLREELGADDPFVKKVLGNKSPEQLATELVKASRLKDLALRKKLFEGGKAALEASDDAMIVFARSIDGDSRQIRKLIDDELDSVSRMNSELVARARFETEGTSSYPDATFTLRLSYGAVRGYEEDGKKVDPITHMGGTFERATGSDPFKLPQSWSDAKAELRPGTAMNFCTDNDIIGGNSGSPVFNKDLQIVGLVFDGNIQSLGGDYGFDETVNRTVAVAGEALVEALEKIYKADRIVQELKPRGAAPAGMR